jgi:hypothetical protein
MMKCNTHREHDFIDKYYNELPGNNFTTKEETEFMEYKNKLEASLEKMDIINERECDLDINILEIVNMADEIKLRKRNKVENLAFIALSLLILLTGVFLVLSFNIKYLVYIEIVITSLFPFLLISLAIYSKARGDI